MSAILVGRHFGKKLADALGLENRRIREITLRVKMDCPVTAQFIEILPRGAQMTADALVTSSQGNAILHEVAHLRSSNGGFHEPASAEPRHNTGFLIADGPAERLARAVLAGDARAALVLADYIQEEWIKHCEGRE